MPRVAICHRSEGELSHDERKRIDATVAGAAYHMVRAVFVQARSRCCQPPATGGFAQVTVPAHRRLPRHALQVYPEVVAKYAQVLPAAVRAMRDKAKEWMRRAPDPLNSVSWLAVYRAALEASSGCVECGGCLFVLQIGTRARLQSLK